jgi:glycosyltransferase involved in cell wall biosynthesis
MRILIANYRYFLSGGPERYMFNVISALENKSHEIIPFSVTYSANMTNPYDGYFVPPLGTGEEIYFKQQKMTYKTLVRTMSRLFYSKEVEQAVTRLINDTRPDVAYVLHYLKKISPSLLVALKKKKVPILVRLSDYAMLCPQNHCIRENSPCTLCLHGDLLPSIRYSCVKNSRPVSVLNALSALFHRQMGYFDLIDTFITTNRFMYDLMREGGWPDHKLTCIPTFTDTQVFRPPKGNLKSDYICYAGRLDEIKGIEVLLKSFSLMKLRQSGLQLRIAGTGSPGFIRKMKSLTETLSIEKDVWFEGRLDTPELSQLLRHAQLTVVPSLWFENLPNAILESFACGTPVIASNLGSLPMAVKTGHTGALFTPGDIRDLAEKTDYYLDHPGLLEEMGKQARSEALTHYSSEAHITNLEKAMNKLLSSQRT